MCTTCRCGGRESGSAICVRRARRSHSEAVRSFLKRPRPGREGDTTTELGWALGEREKTSFCARRASRWSPTAVERAEGPGPGQQQARIPVQGGVLPRRSGGGGSRRADADPERAVARVRSAFLCYVIPARRSGRLPCIARRGSRSAGGMAALARANGAGTGQSSRQTTLAEELRFASWRPTVLASRSTIRSEIQKTGGLLQAGAVRLVGTHWRVGALGGPGGGRAARRQALRRPSGARQLDLRGSSLRERGEVDCGKEIEKYCENLESRAASRTGQ